MGRRLRVGLKTFSSNNKARQRKLAKARAEFRPAGSEKIMPYFGSLVFTPVVKTLQERYGSRQQYARLEKSQSSSGRLGPDESAYIADRDTFYMASLGSTGWPYVQHRGGPRGFVK